ncbi:uncharacterized protein LOC121730632 [Aricia agestis]|uniref:uncharacterized protein LOC121730632 n=1 Tax=Aricia agestis TaxID=91739 RepID=UPI001C205261|nr:uncharacterized protein LOC121730632 [Aricia agestis]
MDMKKDEEKDSVKPVQEADKEKDKVEEVNPDQGNRAQVGLRSDLPEYVEIGHMQNRPPSAWESWRYQPKRVRSVIIEETDAKPTGIVESPEAPASTARTPELEKLDPKPATIVETPEAPTSNSKPENEPEKPEIPEKLENAEPIADNKEQLRYGYLIPTYNYYGNRYPIRLNPSYQSASAVAQNAPGINFAASSANAQGFGNGAAISQAVNYGGLQSAVSSANNNQGSAIAAAQNYGRQSSSVAQAYNNRGRVRYVAPQYQSASAFAANHN